MSILDSKIPEGQIDQKWTNHKNHMKLVAPNNRPKIDVIVLGLDWPEHRRLRLWVRWDIM